MKILITFLCLSCLLNFAFAQEASENAAGEPVRQWNKHTQKLTTYESDAKSAAKERDDLIRRKNAGHKFILDEKGNKRDILKAIVEANELHKTAVEKYEAEKKQLMYRYPGQGDWVQRKYLPMRIKPLEEVEKEVGLHGQLTEIKRQIDEKYAHLRKEARQQAPENDPPKNNNYKPADDLQPQNKTKKLKLEK